MAAANLNTADRTVDLMALFDRLCALRAYLQICLFESYCPGATEALRAWGVAHGALVEDMHIPDAPVPTRVLHVTIANGPDLSVQRDARGERP